MKNVLDLPKNSNFILPVRFIDGFCKKALFSKLALIQTGWIQVRDGDVDLSFGDPHAPKELRTKVQILNPRAYSKIALGGSVGTGEAFIDQDWTCDGLVALIRIFVLNRDALNSLDSGVGKLLAPFMKILHSMRSNNIEGSRKNISAHYDLSNDFFGLFLDQSRMYSAAVYPHSEATLEDAQREKNDRICRKLRLKSSDHVLEIGTGWGGFALHAVQNYGCRVTTTTISQAQYDYAKSQIESLGLGDRITLLFQDYRTLQGSFDKLVSIEMIEAVGLDYIDTYFATCSKLLKPHGAMLLQSILIQDQFFEQAAKSVDFIQTHVFPGAAIPSVSRIQTAVLERTNMKLGHFEDFGLHYARTIREWDERLEKNRTELPRLGFDDRLYRLWKYYFAYCEGGFLERQISVGHFMFTKPMYREEPVLMEALS